MNIPIFPLPVFLLPGGMTRLRIFEPRYLRMVKLATANQGFAIVLNAQDEGVVQLKWASWVDIVDFDQEESGMLTIDVQCKSLVSLSNVTQDNDGLRFADVKELSHWPIVSKSAIASTLTTSLEKVFEQTPMLRDLYRGEFKSEVNWVYSRWLELLPVSLSDKQIFSNANSFEQAEILLNDIIVEKNFAVK